MIRHENAYALRFNPAPPYNVLSTSTVDFATTQRMQRFARYWDMMAMSDRQPAKVIGPDAILKDRPGFDVELLSRESISSDAYSNDEHEILMIMRGHWRLSWDSGEKILAPGDTCATTGNEP